MRTIIAYFTGHEPVIYTAKMYNLLITDPAVETIIDGETGEIIYTR